MKRVERQILRQEQGVTLLEVVLALGLSALVLISVVSFYTSYTKKFSDMGEKLEVATDIESGQQIMLKDLKAMDPSFSNLQLKDDLGKTFFDYYPDVPEHNLDAVTGCGRPCRTYTMRANGAFAEMVFLLHDSSAHELPSLLWDPSWAYAKPFPVGTTTTDGAPPTFSFTNFRDAITNAATGRPQVFHMEGTKKVINWPGYWNDGQLLMFDSPTPFRPDGTTDYAHVPPRPPMFIGRVATNGTQFVPLDPAALDTKKIGGSPDQSNILNRTHPTMVPPFIIDSVDTFLKKLPPNGGGQPMVRLRPVKLIKYSIEIMYPKIDPALPPDEQKRRRNALRVYRSTYKNGWHTDRYRSIIAEKVKTVQLKRSTVTEKAVTFELSKEELKKGGE